ncbi:protein disulfide-isomerase [Malassezia vespertilionis]|uniref:Thioredoxin domain-containing protein n=1 Tax=Malassezia vespertilionis TaxID=2020962 RepID=A0A2N1JEZ4_9BASI|nr:protein disulfide-isomerase [Malassezia vespertilionis]PKI85095.1 hypothetical protein MVES_001351 [Malassezia vespertilionis]WFD06093.1 protein disulfide-isomerase [Malassezia vespertilionis]
MMRCVAVLLAYVVYVQAALFASHGRVVRLDASNFDKEVLQIEKPTMVAFTAQWCGHCKNLAPQYSRVANEMDGVVKLAYVDCEDSASQSLCAKYGVQGFPTLKLFPATKKRLPRDYQGERTSRAIMDHMIDALPTESVRRLEASQIASFVDKKRGEPKIVLFSPKVKSSSLYRSLALDYRERIPFGYVYTGKPGVFEAAENVLGVKLNENTVPALFLIDGQAGGKRVEKYRSSMKHRSISSWVDKVVYGKEPAAPQEQRKAERTSESAAPKPKVSARPGMSEEDVDAAIKIGERLVREEHEETARKLAEEEAVARGSMEALRRARSKQKQMPFEGQQQAEEPVSSEMLMDKLQDMVGDKWGTLLAQHALKARKLAEKIVQDDPAKAFQATEAAEAHLSKALSADIVHLTDQIRAGADDEGYPLTADMETTLKGHLDMFQGMLRTVEARIEARKSDKTEKEYADSILARYDL